MTKETLYNKLFDIEEKLGDISCEIIDRDIKLSCDLINIKLTEIETRVIRIKELLK